MKAVQLKQALDAHSQALERLGVVVTPAVVKGPASASEIDEVESAIGIALPATLREAFQYLSREVSWAWERDYDQPFPEPFDETFTGGLEWSLDTLVEHYAEHLEWTGDILAEHPDGPYWREFKDKLAIGRGSEQADFLVVDLDPEHAGEIVHINPSDNPGHGYLLAHSLADLVERMVPLACPGPGGREWLAFVPHGLGPIDPCCPNAVQWRSLLGLAAAPPSAELSTIADDNLFDSLLESYRQNPHAPGAGKTLERALRICTRDRAEQVLDLLVAREGAASTAATLLGEWNVVSAVPALKDLALNGPHNARFSAISALRAVEGPEAAEALEALRVEVDPGWLGYLNR